MRRVALLAAVGLCALAPAAEAAPKRIVALNPFSANTVADLGVRPVAIGQIPSGDVFWSPRLRGVRRLPLSHPSGPNLEQLATLNPGLVLSSPAWSRGHRAMRRLGINVAETEPRSVHATGAMIKKIGGLIGKKAAAAADRRPQRGRRRARHARDPQAPAGAGDPRDRARPVRVPRQLVGRRHRQPRGRAAADRRTSGRRRLRPDLQRDRGQAQPGHHHRGPARLAEGHAEARRLPAQQPGVARPPKRRARAGSTCRPATRCCSRGRTWAARSATSAPSTCTTELWPSGRPRSCSCRRRPSWPPPARRSRSGRSTCRSTT